MTASKLRSVVSAAEMARLAGVDPKTFRAALRRENLDWHTHNGSWTVVDGSPEHADLERVLGYLANGRSLHAPAPSNRGQRQFRSNSDEAWVIGLCDDILGTQAMRQHRFPFLLGDEGPSGRMASLPVDAYYPALKLVVEYHERQHTEKVGFFDKRMTVSGVHRGEQRRRYDELRRTVLPLHGYRLQIFDYTEFSHDRAGRLMRQSGDREIVRLGLLHSSA